LPSLSLVNIVMTSSTPLIANRTKCFPSRLRKEHEIASLSSSKRVFPCLGASHGDQIRMRENHLVGVSKNHGRGKL
jgi:hypothetical protein